MNELTTNDIAQLLGATRLLKKYAHHLAVHVDAAITNYESIDNDDMDILTHLAFASDCCCTLRDCLHIINHQTKKIKNSL